MGGVPYRRSDRVFARSLWRPNVAILGLSVALPWSFRTDLRARPFKAARDGRMTLLRMSETTAAADGADSNETRKLCLLFVCSSLARFPLRGEEEEEEEKRPSERPT